jgi:hypothetical protein
LLFSAVRALPDGMTAIVWRKSEILHFVDSADAVCAREHGDVSVLCRSMTNLGVGSNNPVLLRLPYSHLLYSISTGGTEYADPPQMENN